MTLIKGWKLTPPGKSVIWNRSIMYQAMGDFQHSFNDIEAYIKLILTMRTFGMKAHAVSRPSTVPQRRAPYYNEAIWLNPRHGLAYLERGRTHQTLGNASGAQADLEKARSLGQNIEPENPSTTQIAYADKPVDTELCHHRPPWAGVATGHVCHHRWDWSRKIHHHRRDSVCAGRPSGF